MTKTEHHYFLKCFGARFVYLGVLLHYNELRREDIQPIIDKIIKNISQRMGSISQYGSVDFME